MVLITELRITMPTTVDEYQVGMLYGVAQASKDNTGGGEGVEVLNNEPFKDYPGGLLNGKHDAGQYTHKIYHLDQKIPSFARALAPKGSTKLKEEAWNANVYCRTVITNPDYMKENFLLKLETVCKADRGETENAHELPPDLLAKRRVVHINIADDQGAEGPSPGSFQCTKTTPPRGPLSGNWIQTCEPVMTVYKLITLEFKWWGFQTIVENSIMSYEEKLFKRFHRQIFCWMNEWGNMTMEDIRALEDQTKDDLEKQRTSGELRGDY